MDTVTDRDPTATPTGPLTADELCHLDAYGGRWTGLRLHRS